MEQLIILRYLFSVLVIYVMAGFIHTGYRAYRQDFAELEYWSNWRQAIHGIIWGVGWVIMLPVLVLVSLPLRYLYLQSFFLFNPGTIHLGQLLLIMSLMIGSMLLCVTNDVIVHRLAIAVSRRL